MLRLFSYFRSSATFRVRIVLNLKGLDYDIEPVHLLKAGGQQFSEAYKKINPQQLVPTLAISTDEETFFISQSGAINEYLEEQYPQPSLMPSSIKERAEVRALVQMIACDIHPLNNLRVLNYLKSELHVSDNDKSRWYHHWITRTFEAIEYKLARQEATKHPVFTYGEAITLADANLIPQVYNALRFDFDLGSYPNIVAVYERCMGLEAFRKAAPENQPDAE